MINFPAKFETVDRKLFVLFWTSFSLSTIEQHFEWQNKLVYVTCTTYFNFEVSNLPDLVKVEIVCKFPNAVTAKYVLFYWNWLKILKKHCSKLQFEILQQSWN